MTTSVVDVARQVQDAYDSPDLQSCPENVVAREVLRIHEPDEALHVRVRMAISDPGAFCVRGGHVLDQDGNLQDDPDWEQDWNGRPKYESISSWGARAVLIVLRDPS